MAWKSKEYARQYNTEYMRGRRRWYRQHGLCAECGTEDAYTMVGHYRCFECSEKRRKTPIEYIKPEQPVKENFRKDESRCYLCGSPVMQGETAYGGRPIRLCEKHYAFIVQMGEKGREAYRKKEGETWGQKQYRLSQKKRKSECTEKSLPRPK